MRQYILHTDTSVRIYSCVPGVWSQEMALIVAQGCLLVSRTWLTDYISRIEARAGRHLISLVRPQLAKETHISQLQFRAVIVRSQAGTGPRRYMVCPEDPHGTCTHKGTCPPDLELPICLPSRIGRATACRCRNQTFTI